MSARSGSTRYHNAVANKISSIAHHNTLTVLCTRFLPKPYLKLRTRATKSIPYIITLRKHTLSEYIDGECRLYYYFAEVYADLLLCWTLPGINTLLKFTLPQYIAGLYTTLTYCRGKSKLWFYCDLCDLWVLKILWESIFIHYCQISRNVVGGQSERSNTSPETPEGCQLGCRILFSMIGYEAEHWNLIVGRSCWEK